MASALTGLSAEQVEFFVANNFVRLEGAIPRELCERWVAAGCAANGIDLADSSTWGERNVRAELSASMPEVAPRLHAAICQLCGGAGRVSNAAGLMLDAGFVVNYDQGADQPWREPKGAAGGWHVDGDFNHFLDAPEAGLFYIICYNDIEYQAGPTYFAPDSIPHVLEQLRDNPDGLSAFALRTSHNIQAQCELSLPTVGAAGDVFLMHPQMLHTSSQNIKRVPRFMRNGQIRLAAPMWTAPSLSPVERCSLRCLGEDSSDGATRLPAGFRAPPDELRGACDHDDGGLLGWAYGEGPSVRDAGPDSPKSAAERGRAAEFARRQQAEQAAAGEAKTSPSSSAKL